MYIMIEIDVTRKLTETVMLRNITLEVQLLSKSMYR